MFGRYRRNPAVVSDPALLNAPQLMIDPQDPNDPLGHGYGGGSAYYEPDGSGYLGEDDDAEDLLRAVRAGDAPLYVAQAKRMHRGFHSEMSAGFRKYDDTIITNPAFLNAAQDFYGPDLGDPGDVTEGLAVVGNVFDDEDLNPGDLIEDIEERGPRPAYRLGAGAIRGHAGAGSVGALYGNILEDALVRAEGRPAYRLGVGAADGSNVFYDDEGNLRSRRQVKRAAVQGRKSLKQIAREAARGERAAEEPEVEFQAYYRAVKRVGRQSQRLGRQAARASRDMDEVFAEAEGEEPSFPGEEGASGFRKYDDTIITNPAFLNSAQAFYGADLGDPGDVTEGLMVVGNAYGRRY